MMIKRIRRPAHATVAAYLALFLALGGAGAWAAGKVGGKQIRRDAIHSRHIDNGQIRSADVRNKTLRAADFRAGALPAGPEGPRGARGAPGLSGIEVVTEDSTTSSGSPRTVRVSCPEGKVPLSGGGKALGFISGHASLQQITVDHFDDSVLIVAHETPPTDEDWTLIGEAVCARPAEPAP